MPNVLIRELREMAEQHEELLNQKQEIDYKLSKLIEEAVKQLTAEKRFDLLSVNWSRLKRSAGTR